MLRDYPRANLSARSTTSKAARGRPSRRALSFRRARRSGSRSSAFFFQFSRRFQRKFQNGIGEPIRIAGRCHELVIADHVGTVSDIGCDAQAPAGIELPNHGGYGLAIRRRNGAGVTGAHKGSYIAPAAEKPYAVFQRRRNSEPWAAS